ncbi:tRNA (mnm(5)s(2)U34)-methyltransferase [Lentibacillus sp. JNUCC-1]|uniref:tRNA (mnm(5)s(2)U34)-methyltransferase n=1 Tax=Lentibacillus sp. JNUCC-1 TaxID=2654513 RepID=UPI0012E72E2C|nr:class I SAM-dependent methyltransferase [Lentibacillus sp. JNUCC-1]
MIKGILQYAHTLLEESLQPGDTAIDATCGNGHDTLFLCQTVGANGHVYAFDIQEQAITNTAQRLAAAHQTNATIIQDSHANFVNHIPVDRLNRIGGAIFNLGYLPGSDKSVVTKGESTILALEGILEHLKPGGTIVLVVYHGHSGGKTEKDALMHYVRSIDQQICNVLYYGFVNQKNNPPFILALHKKAHQDH